MIDCSLIVIELLFLSISLAILGSMSLNILIRAALSSLGITLGSFIRAALV